MIHRIDPHHSPLHEPTPRSDLSWLARYAAPLLLFLVGCFALGYYGYAALDAHFFHSRQAQKSDQALQPSPSANGSAPNAASAGKTGAGENPRAAHSTARSGNAPNENLSGATSASDARSDSAARSDSERRLPPSEELRSEAAAELKGRAANSDNSDSARNGSGKFSFGPFPKLLPSIPSRGVPAMPSFDRNGNSPAKDNSSARNNVSSNTPLGRIEISAISLKAPISEGAGYRSLQRGIGHISGTALLGHTGNVGLAGDSGTFFRKLRNVREGDLITLITSNGAFLYRVDLISITDAENSAVLRNNGENVLTLVTGYPFDHSGNAPKRFVVRAKQLLST